VDPVTNGNNGNVAQITNNLNSARTQSFSYDGLNRIASAKTQATSGQFCWGETFGYDAWGNLGSIGAILPAYSGCTQEYLTAAAMPNNQLSGYGYDAAGNMISNPGIATYTYNAENQMTSTAGITYTYDGDGKRVQKSNGKLYWYGMGSDPLVETDAAGNNPYVFFGGKRIARRNSAGTVSYNFADHLGTSRIVTNASGAVPPLDDSDFYPFGKERPVLASSGNTYKFTGKERDPESGLDNFDVRYFGSTLARFMRPDPDNAGASVENPQSWNAYSYVLNNPLRYIDPFGLDCIYLNEGGDKVNEVKSGDCRSESDEGFYVDGTILNGKAGVTLSDDGQYAAYFLKDENEPRGYTPGAKCIGDCPTTTVNVTAVPPSTPTIGPAPPLATVTPPALTFTYR
jgi:RHS repeat-associated protein